MRDRAVEALAKHGQSALPLLEKTLGSSPSSRQCRNAIWALTRIDGGEARRIVRFALNDKDLSVQLAAIHSAGLHRDAKALLALLRLVNHEEDPAVTRQAATALGRIKARLPIEPIMAAIGYAGDRFREHALIYALIQINDRDKTAEFLGNRNHLVRRAA